MDLATIIGLVIGLAGIFGGFVVEGGNPASLIGPTAAMIVVGGTLGATVISFSLDDVMKLPKLIMLTFKTKPDRRPLLLKEMVELAEMARRDGLLALENKQIDDPFLKRAVMLVVDGSDPETTRDILSLDLEAMEARHERGASIFTTMGGYAPTMGIIGTVMGMVHVLGSLANPNDLGPAIAVAFIATLYGIFTANVIYLPIASKLKLKSKAEINERTMIVEGALAIQAGDNPRVLKEKLSAYAGPQAKAKAEKQAAQPAAVGRVAVADGGE